MAKGSKLKLSFEKGNWICKDSNGKNVPIWKCFTVNRSQNGFKITAKSTCRIKKQDRELMAKQLKDEGTGWKLPEEE